VYLQEQFEKSINNIKYGITDLGLKRVLDFFLNLYLINTDIQLLLSYEMFTIRLPSTYATYGTLLNYVNELYKLSCLYNDYCAPSSTSSSFKASTPPYQAFKSSRASNH
jgi:hypothetical protein